MAISSGTGQLLVLNNNNNSNSQKSQPSLHHHRESLEIYELERRACENLENENGL
jgi:hypothetical protein